MIKPRRIFFRLYQSIRIKFFELLSSQKPEGDFERIQAIQIVGAGKIKALGRVTVGYFPSPHFFSTYGYFEARGKEAVIEIGNNTKINNGFVAIAEKSSIKIGENCLIGACVEIYDSDFHALSSLDRRNGVKHKARRVCIGSDVFIGSNVVILKGVKIGCGSVIANGSLVTRDIPDNCVASGVPARVVRML